MENKIRILYKEVGKMPIEMFIEDKLEVLQKLVGGYIEVAPLTNNIDIVCNEEGKLMLLKPNINLDYDVIVGNIFFVSFDEEGNFKSLTDEQIKTILAELKFRDIIYQDK